MPQPIDIPLIVDHLQRGIDRLTGSLRDDPGAIQYISPLLTEVQILEDLIWSVMQQTRLETAEGAWLDRLGRIVGQDRVGFPDSVYRRLIAARALANRSSGLVDELAGIIGIITEPTRIDWLPHPPSTTVIQYHVRRPIDPAIRTVLKEMIDAATPVTGTTYIYECTTGENVGFDQADGAIGFDRGRLSLLLT